MLNGIAPILIFTLKENPAALSPIFNALSGVPLIGAEASQVFAGIPIPLYLDEKLTGLIVENEAKNIDIETTVEARYDNKKPYVYQRAVNASQTVQLIASKDSLLLPALLALSDMIVPRLVSQNYSVSYINGATIILNGLLQGFNTSKGSNDDLVRIILQIQRQDSRPAPASPNILAPVLGPLP